MLTNPAYFGRNWCDIMAEQEQAKTTRLLRMTPEEWRLECRRVISTWTGDLRNAINYLDEMDAKRAEFARPRAAAATVAPVVVRRPKTEFELDFAVWKDMIEEPAKYGDDIIEWLALNDKLTRGSGRWRLGAFWAQMEEVEAEKEEAREAFEEQQRKVKAVTVIQAAVRGHQARSKQTFRDCCMCLSHRISPLVTDVGCMCRGCAEQGPYEEETGPISDPWSEFRADYVDPVPKPSMCRYCETMLVDGRAFCDDICRQYHADEEEFGDAPLPPRVPRKTECGWCFGPLDEGQTRFCDSDCEYSYMKEAWRESAY